MPTKPSFLSFHYGNSRKSSSKPAPRPGSFKERQGSSGASKVFQPNEEEMRRVFDKFDANKDGKISAAEYMSALRVLGKGNAEAEAARTFESIDRDGDGFVDFKEFVEMYNDGGGVQRMELESAFRVFDLDGSGKISAEELMEVLRRLGELYSLEACRKMVRGVDRDGDGQIDLDEFTSMMALTLKQSA